MRNYGKCLVSIFLVTVFLPSCYDGSKRDESPNIIFILADDMGYGDLGCFGSTEIMTPNIDKLASEGVRFTNGYSASAVCTPTRASFLTGKYPLRFNIQKHFVKGKLDYLPDEGVLTLSEILKEKGYYTFHVGKWHLGGLTYEDANNRLNGDLSIPGPIQQGFDDYLCMEEAEMRAKLLVRREMYRKGGEYLLRNDKKVSIDKHITTQRIDETLLAIERSKKTNKKFFINLWFDVPHTPYEPAEGPFVSWYKNDTIEPIGSHYNGQNRRGDGVRYNSMVSHMDDGVGQIVAKLKELGIYENTLIVFSSDNGPSYRGSTGGYSGGKADLHEGGIKVPYIFSWKNRIPAGKVSEELISSIDLLPTIVEILDYDLSEDIDGTSIFKHLIRGKSINRQWPVFWQLQNYFPWYPQPGSKPEPHATIIARDREWKLLSDDIKALALYNLEKDPLEQDNLLDEYPEIAAKLFEASQNFWKSPRIINK